jgi:hypothetical protein
MCFTEAVVGQRGRRHNSIHKCYVSGATARRALIMRLHWAGVHDDPVAGAVTRNTVGIQTQAQYPLPLLWLPTNNGLYQVQYARYGT